MCGIDCPQTGISIVIGIHAEAEGTIVPEGRCPPVLIVMREAVHLLRETFLLQTRLLDPLAFLLALTLLLQLASRLTCHLLGVRVAVKLKEMKWKSAIFLRRVAYFSPPTSGSQ